MLARTTGTLIVLLGALGCGEDGSGLPGKKELVTLSDSDVATLCDYVVEQGVDHTIDCGNGLTINPDTQADCIADAELADHPDCTATVSDLEACVRAYTGYTDEERCMLTIPEACAPLLTTECAGVF
jgi:hypothetical protein